MFNQEENIRQVQSRINQLIANCDKSVFVIIDGDRTLIPTDSTLFFFDHLKKDFTDLENIFHKSGYSFESFYNAALYYSQIDRELYLEACKVSATCVDIYPEFLSFINSLQDRAELIVVTSGIRQSWKNVLKNHSLEFMHLIGGNYFPDDNFVIDKNAKGLIAEMLIASHKEVFAFGDTMIDFEMLKKATHSFLVVNEKQNDDFTEFFVEIPHLQQISFSDFAHSNLTLTNLVTVANNILRK